MMTMKRKSKFQMTTMPIENTIICFIIGSIFPLETTSTTNNITQLVGRNVYLNCTKSSSDGILWTFNENIYFYNRGEFRGVQFEDRSHFENDSATGKEILRISDLKPGDAGLYKCLDASTETPLQSTQLAILDSEPTFDSNIPDDGFVGPSTCSLSQDYMRFSCAVSYHGTKAPRLRWETANGNQIIKDLNCEERENKTTRWINCTLTLKAEPQYDGSVFRCKVTTSREQYNCSTKAIKVHYFIPKNDSKSGETVNDQMSNWVETNQKYRRNCTLQEDDGEIVWHTTQNRKFYRCTYSYDIKNTKCSAELAGVIAPDLSWSLKSLAIVNSLVLFVFAVVSYFFLENEKVKSTLENINKRFVVWLKLILIVFAVLDFAFLMFILARPTKTLLHMKYAQTVALLLLIFVDALFLLLMQCKCCKCEVSLRIVKIILKLIPVILPVLALFGAVFVTTAAAMVYKELSGSSYGTIDEWTNSFKLILAIFAGLALAAFIVFAIVEMCCKSKIHKKPALLDATFSWEKEVISDAILTNGWAAEKHKILSELHFAGALDESDFAKIRGEEDGNKGISMLLAKIPREREKHNIFKRVMKEILKIDLGDVGSILVRENLNEAEHDDGSKWNIKDRDVTLVVIERSEATPPNV